ncbi:hypothetical protein LSAT2_018598, partial [Lamellibrachia satsuma]
MFFRCRPRAVTVRRWTLVASVFTHDYATRAFSAGDRPRLPQAPAVTIECVMPTARLIRLMWRQSCRQRQQQSMEVGRQRGKHYTRHHRRRPPKVSIRMASQVGHVTGF